MSCAKSVTCSFHYEEAYPAPPPLCRATTAKEIDAHLENLYQRPEVGIMRGLEARDGVINNHTYQVHSERLETIYQSIIEVTK